MAPQRSCSTPGPLHHLFCTLRQFNHDCPPGPLTIHISHQTAFTTSLNDILTSATYMTTANRKVQLLNVIIFSIFNISLIFSSPGETLFSRLSVLLVIVVLLAIIWFQKLSLVLTWWSISIITKQTQPPRCILCGFQSSLDNYPPLLLPVDNLMISVVRFHMSASAVGRGQYGPGCPKPPQYVLEVLFCP